MNSEFFVTNDEQRQKLMKFFQENENSTKVNLDAIVGGAWYDIMKPQWPESTWRDTIKPKFP